jgi:hypothetical protein
MSGSYSSNKNQQSTQTQDNKIALGDGGGLALSGNAQLSVQPYSTLNITSSSTAVAEAAIDAATKLAAGSNTIASQVADSTSKLVDVSSGQKNAVYITGAALLAAILIARK